MAIFYNLNVNILMYLGKTQKKTKHIRKSKSGIEHAYHRHKTLILLHCDNCDAEFTRERGSMDPKRLSNSYFHVCKNCDSKKFAQKMGVTKKQVWNMSASSDLPISKL
jgi:NAD-dependent SIR2 family protein deacetylase